MHYTPNMDILKSELACVSCGSPQLGMCQLPHTCWTPAHATCSCCSWIFLTFTHLLEMQSHTHTKSRGMEGERKWRGKRKSFSHWFTPQVPGARPGQGPGSPLPSPTSLKGHRYLGHHPLPPSHISMKLVGKHGAGGQPAMPL